ncbi:MAG: phage integrase N-terminal SAM-like domain-containing protein [Thermodesulfobacteriota bacterium]|nr:phage integrase N-terminal SAM-like domain-containing protein [Thermodesulfobacteriota bacterium]
MTPLFFIFYFLTPLFFFIFIQTFLKSIDPNTVSVEDVKAFLSWLAVKQNISASSQNQAFNALLFLFRNVFGEEFGKVDGVVRAG